MPDRLLRLTKGGMFLFLYFLLTAACGLTTPTVEPTAVLPTVADVGLVETSVAQTVAASAPQGTTPEGTAPTTDNSPDLADPNSGMEAIKATADVNVASTVPQVRVSFSSVNVRNGPGTNYRVISVLLKDSVLPVVAKNPAGNWFLIDLPGGERGWIADSVTNPVAAEAFANLMVAATIPAPPATSTATPPATATSTPRATVTGTPRATTTPTPAGPPNVSSTITVINSTPVNVCFLFIDLSSEPWSIDRLGTSILASGSQMSFDFPAGEYDFMAEDCNGDTFTLFNQFVSGSFTWEILPSAPPPSTTSTITVINRTPINICFLFIDLSSEPWSDDRLGTDILEPDFQISFDFPDGEYDFMAEDCNGDTFTLFNQFVSGSFTWEVFPSAPPPPTTSTITVINRTTINICFLFIDLSSEPWSDDRLGTDILEPDFQISFDFPDGEYDFLAEDCNGDTYTLFNQTIAGSFTWEVTP